MPLAGRSAPTSGLADIATSTTLGNQQLPDILQLLGFQSAGVSEAQFQAAYDRACNGLDEALRMARANGDFLTSMNKQDELVRIRNEYTTYYVPFRHLLNDHARALRLINRRSTDLKSRGFSIVDFISSLITDPELRAILMAAMSLGFKAITPTPQGAICPHCQHMNGMNGHADHCPFNNRNRHPPPPPGPFGSANQRPRLQM